MDRKARVLLADLFYVNHLTKNRLCVPLNIGYINSYVEELCGQDVEISMYKDVDLLLKEIKMHRPDIVGFSFYYWNQNLNNYVVQQIRELYGSDVLIVFGGPSVDSEEAEQLKLFNKFPEVDIFVQGEGEAGFAAIVKRALGGKGSIYGSPIDCSLFLRDGQLVKGENTSTNLDLSSIPSPYLNGSLDQFLKAEYMPLLQATRTCPYQCTFCVEGKERSRLRAFPLEQVKKEIQSLKNNDDRKFIEHLLEGKLTSEMKEMTQAMVDTNIELLQYLSPENWIQSITNKVFIMHGANDSMVPFTESTYLHENLKNSTLLISFLYEHREISTDRGILYKLQEFAKLINFNAKYIRYNL